LKQSRDKGSKGLSMVYTTLISKVCRRAGPHLSIRIDYPIFSAAALVAQEAMKKKFDNH